MDDLAASASDADPARVVGNLAGVVEWANDAFARLSGIGLDETVHKPIGRLLERAGIDLEIVDFVAQHFFEGRVCHVAFPFERPDGRRIDVLLEVEALRDAVGEIDRFSAIAREASANATAIPAKNASRIAAAPSSPRLATIASAQGPVIDLGRAVRRAVAARLVPQQNGSGPSEAELGFGAEIGFSVELDLEAGLAPIELPGDARLGEGVDGDGAAAGDPAQDGPASEAVAALVTALVEAARLGVEETGSAGGVLTLSTAFLVASRRFVSRVHPIAACPSERSEGGDVVLEIHDTGLALPASVVEALRRGDPDGFCASHPSSRARALAQACRRARSLGGRIHLDSTPGCGSQLLVLFAPAQAR